jgi:hypothetical protein
MQWLGFLIICLHLNCAFMHMTVWESIILLDPYMHDMPYVIDIVHLVRHLLVEGKQMCLVMLIYLLLVKCLHDF